MNKSFFGVFNKLNDIFNFFCLRQLFTNTVQRILKLQITLVD